eukprot:jgi/Bigna1/140931/aug1.59_g15639
MDAGGADGASQNGRQRDPTLASSLPSPKRVMHMAPLNLGLGKRVQPLCVTCSRELLAVGASTGSVYFYTRDTLSFLQMSMCSAKGLGVSPIMKVTFSPVEPDLFAVARLDGLVMLFHGNFQKLTKKAIWLCTIQNHSEGRRSNGAAAEKKAAGTQVTNLVWSPNGRWLYSADDKGRVARTYIWPEMATGVAYEDIETWTIMEAESSVVQMHSYIRKRRPPAQDPSSSSTTGPATNTTQASADVKSRSAAEHENKANSTAGEEARNHKGGGQRAWSALLLVSTRKRSVLIDVSDPNKTPDSVVQIGSKPHKKEGSYGACLHPTKDLHVLAARKGKRLWEAEIEKGQVLKTFKFKLDTDTTFAFQPFSTPVPIDKEKHTSEWLKENVQLHLLTPFGDKVISWGYGTSLMILDPSANAAAISAWHLDCGQILDLAIPPPPPPSSALLHGDDEFFIVHSRQPRVLPPQVMRIKTFAIGAAISTLLYQRHMHGMTTKTGRDAAQLRTSSISSSSSFANNYNNNNTLLSCVALAVYHNLREDKPILAALRKELKTATGADDKVKLPPPLMDKFKELVQHVAEDMPLPILRDFVASSESSSVVAPKSSSSSSSSSSAPSSFSTTAVAQGRLQQHQHHRHVRGQATGGGGDAGSAFSSSESYSRLLLKQRGLASTDSVGNTGARSAAALAGSSSSSSSFRDDTSKRGGGGHSGTSTNNRGGSVSSSSQPIPSSSSTFEKFSRAAAASGSDIASFGVMMTPSISFPPAEVVELAKNGLHRGPKRRMKKISHPSSSSSSSSYYYYISTARRKRIMKWEKLNLLGTTPAASTAAADNATAPDIGEDDADNTQNTSPGSKRSTGWQRSRRRRRRRR